MDPVKRGTSDDVYSKITLFIDIDGFQNGRINLKNPIYKDFSHLRDDKNETGIVILEVPRALALNYSAWATFKDEVERMFSHWSAALQRTPIAENYKEFEELEIFFDD